MITEGHDVAEIRRAAPDDLAGIERLLVANHLPTEGVDGALNGFFVAEYGGELVGVVGVEECGRFGLLRSTAVSPEWRSRGLGRRLVQRTLAESEKKGMRALYLLTTTAEQYFPRFGFAKTTRDDVPEAIRRTDEFTSACPASATVMVYELGRRNSAS